MIQNDRYVCALVIHLSESNFRSRRPTRLVVEAHDCFMLVLANCTVNVMPASVTLAAEYVKCHLSFTSQFTTRSLIQAQAEWMSMRPTTNAAYTQCLRAIALLFLASLAKSASLMTLVGKILPVALKLGKEQLSEVLASVSDDDSMTYLHVITAYAALAKCMQDDPSCSIETLLQDRSILNRFVRSLEKVVCHHEFMIESVCSRLTQDGPMPEQASDTMGLIVTSMTAAVPKRAGSSLKRGTFFPSSPNLSPSNSFTSTSDITMIAAFVKALARLVKLDGPNLVTDPLLKASWQAILQISSTDLQLVCHLLFQRKKIDFILKVFDVLSSTNPAALVNWLRCIGVEAQACT